MWSGCQAGPVDELGFQKNDLFGPEFLARLLAFSFVMFFFLSPSGRGSTGHRVHDR